MKLPARTRTPLVFNITPLIDIVFNIMIFFLVTAHFVRSQETDPVELPEATQIVEKEPSPQRLVLTILPDHSFRVSGRNLSLDEIDFLLGQSAADADGEFEVQLRGDRNVPYRVIEPVLLACAKHGIQDFGFRVFEANP
jgi:biopolymer transport protein ExbD